MPLQIEFGEAGLHILKFVQAAGLLARLWQQPPIKDQFSNLAISSQLRDRETIYHAPLTPGMSIPFRIRGKTTQQIKISQTQKGTDFLA